MCLRLVTAMPCYGAFPCGNLRGNELSHLHMWKIEENLCNSLPDLPTILEGRKCHVSVLARKGFLFQKIKISCFVLHLQIVFPSHSLFKKALEKHMYLFQHQGLVILLMLQKISDVKTNPM